MFKQELEELEEEDNNEEVVDVPADATSQTKSNPPALQNKKKTHTKSRKETPTQPPMSPVEFHGGNSNAQE